MEKKNNAGQPQPGRKAPRFSLTWLYILIGGLLLALYLSGGGNMALKEVSYNKFKEYVAKGYVNRVVTYTDNSLEMYIAPAHVKDVFKETNSQMPREPMISTRVPSNESVSKYLEEQRELKHFTGKEAFP